MTKFVYVFCRLTQDEDKFILETHIYSSISAFIEDCNRHKVLITQNLKQHIDETIKEHTGKDTKEIILFNTDDSCLILTPILTDEIVMNETPTILQENFSYTPDR